MEEQKLMAALAGLLHDVGKFAQRAAEGTHIQWDDETEAEFKYKHALYTDDVVGQIVPERWREKVRAAAGRHHRPTTHLEQVVALADRLSAGERSDERADHPKQLRSIFCSLTGLDEKAPDAKYLPLKKLAIEKDTIFPSDQIDDSHAAYKKLWDGFLTEAQSLKAAHESDGNLAVYVDSLLNLMQTYTWCIPSAYYHSVPDVSLYDHSRMTAALAACLVEMDDLPTLNSAEPIALLVGGDISGVQKFIYTISSSGAAKSLRGRSFYLQLLTEVVAQYVLRQLELPATNLIYAGGGNFFLLAPRSAAEPLKAISRDVTERLLNAHNGDLHLILAHTPVAAQDFNREHFHEAWKALHKMLNRAKLRPLADLPPERLAEEIGTPAGEGGDTDRQCKVCGREIGVGETLHPDSDGNRTCRLCESFTELGNALPKATHFVTVYSEPKHHQNIQKWWQGVESFGVNVWAVNAGRPPAQNRERYVEISSAVHHIEVARIKTAARFSERLMSELGEAGVPVANTIKLFAQLTPEDRNGYPKTFDMLAKDAHGGFKRWGVLRMDVDNLGKLFEKGFFAKKDGAGENKLTLSRLAQLSFNLRLFFEGWLPNLAGEDKDRLYIQYAGGDDLFVVGSWDALPPFATRIRESFRKFTAGHEGLTISGGVTLAPEKYPLYQAAREAEAAEGQAKAYVRPNSGKEKDAFYFLGQVIPWEELPPIVERVNKLVGWCGEDGPVSRALLQNLLSIYLEYRQGRAEAIKTRKWDPNKPYFGPWMWHLAYQLARRREDKRTPQEVKDELVKIENEILTSRKDIETIGLAARWAQYLIRK